MAHWLTVRGYPTSRSDVKNATRPGAALAEGGVAAVDSSLALLRELVAEFPALEVERLFAPADVPAARAFLAGEAPR